MFLSFHSPKTFCDVLLLEQLWEVETLTFSSPSLGKERQFVENSFSLKFDKCALQINMFTTCLLIHKWPIKCGGIDFAGLWLVESRVPVKTCAATSLSLWTSTLQPVSLSRRLTSVMWGELNKLCKTGGKSLGARRGWLDNAIITQQTESHGGGTPQSDWSEPSHRRGFVSSQLQTHSARRSLRTDALTQDSSLSVDLLQCVTGSGESENLTSDTSRDRNRALLLELLQKVGFYFQGFQTFKGLKSLVTKSGQISKNTPQRMNHIWSHPSVTLKMVLILFCLGL